MKTQYMARKHRKIMQEQFKKTIDAFEGMSEQRYWGKLGQAGKALGEFQAMHLLISAVDSVITYLDYQDGDTKILLQYREELKTDHDRLNESLDILLGELFDRREKEKEMKKRNKLMTK
ncbi:hypothetical protein [Bacillus cereus]|uniref:hypothetical protein n=1 Tax=Bacillus cereus TaxID=1396 RepID=UPI0005E98513|nr:hypothetical protein [Bacillus cereus]MDF9488815.1 hypothetical protein [Bacillus cereus]COE97970.1 Uncharacterised protein [Streptococcus pneumoniae]